MRRLVEAGLEEARTILTAKRDDLETLAKGLLEYETLSGDEIKDLLAGKPPVRDSGDEPPTSKVSAVPTAGRTKRDPGAEPGMTPQPQA